MLGLDSKTKGWVTAAALLVSVFMAGVLSAAAFLQLAGPSVDRFDPEHRREGARDGRPAFRGGGPDGRFGGGPGGDRQDQFLAMLTERLDLDDDQQTQVREILANRDRIADQVMRSVRDRLQAVMDSLDAEMRDVLTDEQRDAFDEIQREGRDRLGRRFPGRGGQPDKGRPPPD